MSAHPRGRAMRLLFLDDELSDRIAARSEPDRLVACTTTSCSPRSGAPWPFISPLRPALWSTG
jgi:hypothetical protein